MTPCVLFVPEKIRTSLVFYTNAVTFAFMLQVHTLTFNPFSENTYILSDDTKACVIIDPGCFEANEEVALVSYLQKLDLRPEKILLTHGHIDHIFGLKFCKESFQVPIFAHEGDLAAIKLLPQICPRYGLPSREAPLPEHFLNEGGQVTFGNSSLDVIFTPGHSPGSISFYHAAQNFIIGGDVLFQQSIGRSDLPGGDYPTLEKTIREKFYTLPEETVVYPGHGPSTTIGFEMRNNMFVQA